jgi:hypothetical protein
MMDDLIRRNDALTKLQTLYVDTQEGFDRAAIKINVGITKAVHGVQDIPAVDAVEVVRCRECKYAHLTYDGECKYCDRWEEEYERSEHLYLPPDFYCALGQRRSCGSWKWTVEKAEED